MDLFFLWMCIFSRGTITTSNSVVIVWLLYGANGYFTGLSCKPQPVNVATYGIYA